MPRGLLPSIIVLTAQKETRRVPKPSINTVTKVLSTFPPP